VALTRVDRDWLALARDLVVALGVAGAVFALSYENGGFDATTRAYAGISAWWLLGLGAVFGIGVARSRINRFALWALGLLSAFAIWALISVRWAPDAERTFTQFDQISLYVAVLALAIVLGRMVSGFVVVSGMALALAAVAGVALVSRLYPSTFGVKPSTILYSLNNRLSFPLGYWNGLGIEVALAYPLLLAIMTSRRSRLVSTLAALPLPVIAADMYLTSSRGAFVAAGVALIAYFLLTPKRWPALAAVVLAGIGGAVAVGTLVPRKALVSGEMSTSLGIQQGHYAALVIGITCALSAAAWFGLRALGPRVPEPPRRAGQVLAGLLVLAAVAGAVAAHPLRRFDAFKRSGQYGGANQTFITQHLLSTSGSGRWQFWGTAISEFRAHPLNGGGAGSWIFWWLHRASIPLYSQFAHSLYLEALAELGIIGFLLIAGAVVVALIGAVRSALLLGSGEVAAAAAAATAFFAAAAYDWIWQLAGIAVVGVGLAGAALGAHPSTRIRAWRREGLFRPALAVVAVAAIVPQVVVLSAGIHLHNSRSAVRAGNAARATSEALAAKAIEPWAESPYLQLALIAKAEGRYQAAENWLQKAIRRSPNDWEPWYTAAAVDALLGRVAAFHHDLAQVRVLYPSNPLLTSGS